MLQGEHSAIRLTFIKLLFVIKTFVLSIFEWRFYTGFTVTSLSCADPGIFVRGGGGGGGPGKSDNKSSDNGFFLCVCLVLSLFYRK